MGVNQRLSTLEAIHKSAEARFEKANQLNDESKMNKAERKQKETLLSVKHQAIKITSASA